MIRMQDLDTIAEALGGRVCVHVGAEHARQLLGYVGGHGLPRPGGFYRALFAAALRADPMNLERLSRGFPDVATTVLLYSYTIDGYEHLCRLAGVEPLQEGPYTPIDDEGGSE